MRIMLDDYWWSTLGWKWKTSPLPGLSGRLVEHEPTVQGQHFTNSRRAVLYLRLAVVVVACLRLLFWWWCLWLLLVWFHEGSGFQGWCIGLEDCIQASMLHLSMSRFSCWNVHVFSSWYLNIDPAPFLCCDHQSNLRAIYINGTSVLLTDSQALRVKQVGSETGQWKCTV